jgi:hypothetical protein
MVGLDGWWNHGLFKDTVSTAQVVLRRIRWKGYKWCVGRNLEGDYREAVSV